MARVRRRSSGEGDGAFLRNADVLLARILEKAEALALPDESPLIH